nr:ABC transporter ATP-binding protein [uncultured Acetatifactor sp.]
MNHSKGETSYPLKATLKRMLRNAALQNPRLFLFCGIYTAAAAVYPFLAVLLPKAVLGELQKGEQARPEAVLIIAAGYFVLAGIFGFVRTFLLRMPYSQISLLRLDYVKATCVKIMEMAYPHCEDAVFNEKYEKAFIATQSNDNGVEGIYHKLYEIPAVFLVTLGLSVFIGRLSIPVLLGLLLNLAVIVWIGRRSHSFRYERKEEEARQRRRVGYYNRVTSDFSYGKDIRMYGMKKRILENASEEIRVYRKLNRLLAGKEYHLGFLGLATVLLSDILIYGTLINRTVNGMSIADFSMYLTAVLTLSAYLKEAAEKLSFVVNEGQYVHELYRFLDTDMGEKGGDRQAVRGDTLEIVFDDVSFRYPGSEKDIFRHLNLTIHKGERLAVVGVNGAGKTTLVSLMMGLYDVTEGEIRINGIPIAEFDKKELYSMFSAVFQDVNILAFTVRENVAGRLEGIDDSRVANVLAQVGLTEAVNALPKRAGQMMLKVIEEDGAQLSGGQNQKLAIARALYKGANMVIMDEPTAALDPLAEAEIYENFSELVKGKTAVYISHRLASTRFCDHIAFFDGEGLKEYGTHEELMARRGGYYEMFTVQGKYYTQPDAQVMPGGDEKWQSGNCSREEQKGQSSDAVGERGREGIAGAEGNGHE